MSSYTPIDCQMHSSLELHIMHGDELKIEWKNDGNGTHIQLLKPLDIMTEKALGEFLLLEDKEGNKFKIRQDKILNFGIK